MIMTVIMVDQRKEFSVISSRDQCQRSLPSLTFDMPRPWFEYDQKLSSDFVDCTAWKVSKYGVFSGPYFPAFGLNTEIYSVNLRIQSEYRKIRTRKTSVFGHFSRSVEVAQELEDLYGNPYQCVLLLLMSHQPAKFVGEGTWPASFWKDLKVETTLIFTIVYWLVN